MGRHGGVLAVAGDDPISKSSTLPTHSEVALFDARMPILFPGNVREVIEYGRYGFELSRYCGCWVGFKIVTDVADGFSTVDVSPIADVKRPDFTFNGQPWRHLQSPALLASFSLQMEREIQLGRLEAARLFASGNHLNQITVSSPQDRIGLVALGKTYYDQPCAAEQRRKRKRGEAPTPDHSVKARFLPRTELTRPFCDVEGN